MPKMGRIIALSALIALAGCSNTADEEQIEKAKLLGPEASYEVAKEMLKNGGLITEFMSQTPGEPSNFPRRNRIVAGMSEATIVVESGIKGGSFITANMANSYNREVFAVPGSVYDAYSSGCNQLIRQNKAHLLQGVEDFLEVMDWKANSKE